MKTILQSGLIITGIVSLIVSNSCRKEEQVQQTGSGLTESNKSQDVVGPATEENNLILLGSAEMFREHGTSDSDIYSDLELIDHVLKQYRKIHQQHPVGLNDEITTALTGANPKSLVFIAPTHPSIIGSELHDRYGSPYHFHQNSGISMTITSAGEDKKLFTQDDQRIHSH